MKPTLNKGRFYFWELILSKLANMKSEWVARGRKREGVKMNILKKTVVISLITLLLLTLLPQMIFAAPQTSKYQTWYLDNALKSYPPPAPNANYTMWRDKQGVPPPATGSLQLSTGNKIWVSDEISQGVTFTSGTWSGKIDLPDKPRVFDINNIVIQLGYFNGSFHMIAIAVLSETPYGATYTISAPSFTIPSGAYLALKIINNYSSALEMRTGGDHSWIQTPPNSPNYPVPELAAGILLGLGLAGLGAFIFIKRKKIRAA